MLSKHSSNLLIKALLVLYVTVALSSCASAPDVLICTEIHMTKGFCTKTISNEDVIIDDEHPYTFEPGEKPMTWWELRPYMILAPIPSWKEIKAYIIKSCRSNSACKGLAGWDRKIEELDKRATQE